jgi:hypothetical protein
VIESLLLLSSPLSFNFDRDYRIVGTAGQLSIWLDFRISLPRNHADFDRLDEFPGQARLVVLDTFVPSQHVPSPLRMAPFSITSGFSLEKRSPRKKEKLTRYGFRPSQVEF